LGALAGRIIPAVSGKSQPWETESPELMEENPTADERRWTLRKKMDLTTLSLSSA
jgi:hypothetical protein